MPSPAPAERSMVVPPATARRSGDGPPAAWPGRAASVVVLGVVAVALATFVLVAGTPRLLAIVPDDAAYFFQIAAHASAGEGLTFDGIHRTNGFQPLWLGVLVLAHTIARGAPETMLRVFLLLQIALVTAAAGLVHDLLARTSSRHVAFLSVLVLVFWVCVPAVNGMESALLVCSLALACSYATRAGVLVGGTVGGGVGRRFVLGLLLGVVVLARLDTVFLVVAVCAGDAVRILGGGDRRHASARLAATLGGVGLLVGPYLVFNVLSFGAAMPISGRLKSSFPAFAFTGSLPGSLPETLDGTGRLGLLLAAAQVVWFVLRRRRPQPLHAVLAFASAGVLLHFLHTVLFMKWAVFAWHFVAYGLVGTLIGSQLLWIVFPRVPLGAARVAYLAVAGVVVALGLARTVRLLDPPLERSWGAAAYEAALWARRATPATAVFAMSDCGAFGYYSRRRTINLDGVVNDMEFQAVLRRRELQPYLQRCGVRFLAHHAFWNRPDILSGSYAPLRMSYTSRSYGTQSDEIVVSPADEAYRSPPYFDGPYETVFLVWKLPLR
ncbi:MAG: hypothetical protein R3F56_18270 [Planctomycetota bacterium]